MAALDFRLLNDFQRGFPLCARPFLALARQLGCGESEVLARLHALQASGSISRVGAVLRPGTVGASTLAAMAVPPARLDQVAALVTSFAEVNHNYEREHGFNLWFVVTAAAETRLQRVLDSIAAATGIPVMSLPLVREYRIDLGFDLREDVGLAQRAEAMAGGAPATVPARSSVPRSDAALIAALQAGLALVPQPYAELARRAGLNEHEVLERLGRLIQRGVIKRFGIIVSHRSLGFVANAMVVFDVPDAEVDDAGARIADSALATLCYRRVRRLPQWPYNLYCMIHSRARHDALLTLATLREHCALAAYPYAVLFSCHCYKQRGAHYLPQPAVAHG